MDEERSSHWKARLMLANANSPSLGLSCKRLLRVSWTMTLDMKDELLLVILFLGFFRLLASLTATGASSVLPCPNAGALVAKAGRSLEFTRPPSLLSRISAED